MNNKKIIDVLDLYEENIRNLSASSFNHLRIMIPKVKEFVHDNRRDKAFRWLGFIQGVFWSEGYYSIEELKNHNKPDDDIDPMRKQDS
jgi:hypothetical protein